MHVFDAVALFGTLAIVKRVNITLPSRALRHLDFFGTKEWRNSVRLSYEIDIFSLDLEGNELPLLPCSGHSATVLPSMPRLCTSCSTSRGRPKSRAKKRIRRVPVAVASYCRPGCDCAKCTACHKNSDINHHLSAMLAKKFFNLFHNSALLFDSSGKAKLPPRSK